MVIGSCGTRDFGELTSTWILPTLNPLLCLRSHYQLLGMPPKRKTRSGGAQVTGSGDGPSKLAPPGTAGDESGSSKPQLSVSTPSLLLPEDIATALSRYSSHIDQMALKPDSKVQELDEWRLGTLSDAVKSRSPAYVDKEELQKLMNWKLYA